MARLVLTNDPVKWQKAVDINIRAGFNDFVSEESSGIYISVHKKKVKKTDNILMLPNGDFCSIVGTCIYNDEYGHNALKKAYEDFDGCNVGFIREKAIGNYVFCIKKDGHIVVFVDKYQVLKVYYFNIDGVWFVTNSLADVGRALDKLEIHEFGFMQETMLVGTVGPQSMFKNTFRLFGHEYIDIDVRDGSFNFRDLPYARKRRSFTGSSIEEAVSEYASLVKDKFKIVSKFFGDNVRIHQTGGLDNRTVFAAFMSVGCKPKITYGVGNSILSNTKEEDLVICKKYQEKFDLDFYEMNWREDYIGAGKYWPRLFNQYGFDYHIYGGSRSFFSEYEGKISPYPSFMECGYFLENLRLREFARDSKKREFSISDFVEDYLLGGAYGDFKKDRGFYSNLDGFKRDLCTSFEFFMELYGIGDGRVFSAEDFDQVRWIHSRSCDSIMVNFLNDFAPSIAMFSLPELHEFPFDVPAIWRENGRFQLMLINELCPDALDIPVFSHCKRHKFNKNDFSLVPENSFSELIAKKMRDWGVSKNIYNGLRGIYRKVSGSRDVEARDHEERRLKKYTEPVLCKYARFLKNSVDTKKYEGSFVYLMILTQYLYGVALIEREKES